MNRTINPANTDAIIFDMDGTLWNANQSYAKIWNLCIHHFGLKGHVEADDLLKYMGFSIDQIFDQGLIQVPPQLNRKAFLKKLAEIEDQMMPTLGGVLFSGVYDGLEKLSKHYKLFLLSNCSALGLFNFMRFTGTEAFFTDVLSWGMNPVPKAENMKCLMAKHNLQHPVYVGDTQQDCDQTHAADLPFIYMTYGFGDCADADMKVESFQKLTNLFLNNG